LENTDLATTVKGKRGVGRRRKSSKVKKEGRREKKKEVEVQIVLVRVIGNWGNTKKKKFARMGKKGPCWGEKGGRDKTTPLDAGRIKNDGLQNWTSKKRGGTGKYERGMVFYGR